MQDLPPHTESRQNTDGVAFGPHEINPKPVWSVYASAYDSTLCRTATYQAMLRDLLGKSGPLSQVCDGRVVFDLGCGTGNLSQEMLATYPNTTLIAVDHDPAMAKIYKKKLSAQLRDKPTPGRAFFMETDISKAMSMLRKMGISADYVFLVNVLFLVPDPETMLRKIAGGLHKNGELRLSNPYDKTDVDKLFKSFRTDLLEQNEFENLKNEFNAVKAFNDKQLSPMLHRFSQEQLVATLKLAGFSKLNHVSNDHYGGQSLLISAMV